MPCIYKITNCVNGKCYVGQTRTTLKHRWGQHKAEGKSKRQSTQILYKAMKKYGVDNFTIECLQECLVEELDSLEIYWINKLDTYKNGYNMTIGGPTMRTKPKETIMDRRRPIEQYTLQGKFIAKYESIVSAAKSLSIHPKVISSCCNNRQHTAGGYIFCFELDINKIQELKDKLLRTNKNAFYVKQYSLEGEFLKEYESANAAGRELGISISGICKCCRGEQYTHKGYQWCYTGKENTIKSFSDKRIKVLNKHKI